MRTLVSVRGFTLLESLVALAIMAVALAAVLRVTSAATEHAADMKLRLLADWVAQNRLAWHAVRGDWLPLGVEKGQQMQAGVAFEWTEEVSATPNPVFRRIEVSVRSVTSTEPIVLRRLSGYLVQVPRR